MTWRDYQLQQMVTQLDLTLFILLTFLGIAVISVAFQLTEACIKLYRFWEEVEDGPQEVKAIQEDLQYLISIFGKIESSENHVGECVMEGMQHCQAKVLVSCRVTVVNGAQSYRSGTECHC
jgi:hypothetical protein